MVRRFILVSILAVPALAIVLWRRPPEIHKPETKSLPHAAPTFVGAKRCAGCHAQVAEAWRRSHHAKAMEEANDSTVLGDFRNGRFTKDGLTTSFHQRDGKRYVRTDGLDG